MIGEKRMVNVHSPAAKKVEFEVEFDYNLIARDE
jgi:hypothetical protein